jgi:hypothetical protein
MDMRSIVRGAKETGEAAKRSIHKVPHQVVGSKSNLLKY